MAQCKDSIYVQLFAGFAGGTASTIVTAPLEVLKTRLQSSAAQFQRPVAPVAPPPASVPPPLLDVLRANEAVRIITTRHASVLVEAITRQHTAITLAKHMQRTEGLRSFFKGLPANFIGVAPARALYFCAYDRVSRAFTVHLGAPKDHIGVHMCAGFCAGFVNQSVTSPIWFIKTRLQLSTQNGFTLFHAVRNTFRAEGVRGFYRGLSASYYGIIETMIHFAIYEKLKKMLRDRRDINDSGGGGGNSVNKTWDYAVAAAISKTIASCCAYPHEVARTRLRQEDGPAELRKYRSFFQTLRRVYVEEGTGGLYGGLRAQLVRQVFSMTVMFMVYENIVARNWCDWWKEDE